MKTSHAVAVLAVPLALTWALFLAGLCLTPFWECNVQIPPSIIDVLKPALFVIFVLTVVAIIVLMVDHLMLQILLPRVQNYRLVVSLIIGGIVATLPRIIWSFINGQGINAFAPQVEYLPFMIAGSVFILFLERLTRVNKNK